MKLLLILIFLLLILSNQNYYYYVSYYSLKKYIIYHYLMNEQDKKKFNYFLEWIEKNGYYNYMKTHDNYLTLENNVTFIKFFDENYDNPDIYNKKDSLTETLVNFLVPKNILGYPNNNSLFLMNYELRGKDNLYKEYYSYPLKKEFLDIYSNKINDYLKNIKNKEIKLYDFCKNICIDLTFILHFDKYPSKEIKRIMNLAVDNYQHFYILKRNNEHREYIFNTDYFMFLLSEEYDNLSDEICIIGLWKKMNKINKNDCIIEFIHNIVGMTINWLTLLYKYMINLDNNIPKNNNSLINYIHECFRYICPTTILASKKYSDYQIYVYDIENVCKSKELFGNDSNNFNENRFNDNDFIIPSKCPFSKYFKEPCNIPKCKKKGYIPFGSGYRRCPGENISYAFFTEFYKFIIKKEFNLNKLENKIYLNYDIINDFYLKIN